MGGQDGQPQRWKPAPDTLTLPLRRMYPPGSSVEHDAYY